MENKRTIQEKLHIPTTGRISSVININPSEIRFAIQNGNNLMLQDAIDTLISADGHFSGKISDRLSILKKAELKFSPHSDSKKDQEINDFVKENLTEILDKKILKHLLNAIFRRFSVAEIKWTLKDNKYRIEKLKELQPRSFEFTKYLDPESTEENRLVIYDFENDIATEIPENKTIQTFASIKFENKILSISEVVAILIVIKYYALQKDWPRFNELFGLPMLLGTYEQGANERDIQNLFNAIKSLGSNAAGVVGGLTKIDTIQPSNNSPEPFERIINMCNQEISKAITGQAGTSGSGQESSYASMKILNGIREDIAQESLDLVSQAVNDYLIKPLVDFNFGTGQYPKFELVLPVNVNELLDVDTKFKNLGIKFTKQYFIKRYNLNEEDFELIEQNNDQNFLNRLLENDPELQEMLKKKANFRTISTIESADPFF